MAGVSPGSLGKNMLYNLLGLGAPLIAAVAAIPSLIQALGVARFGVVALVWVIIGYFSLFDLGIGRALTQRVADALGRHAEGEIPALMATALVMLGLLGSAGAAVLASLSPWVAVKVAGNDAVLADEALTAFRLSALSIPVVVSAAALRGMLEAHQRFGVVNVNRAAMGVLMFVVPLGVSMWSNHLGAIVLALFVVRFGSWLGYFKACRSRGMLGRPMVFCAPVARRLIGYGGWVTVSNVIGPIMDSLDRLLVGMLAGAAAVAYYAIPAEAVTKVLVLPAAVAAAFFPTLTIQWATNRERVGAIYSWGMKCVAAAVVPVAATLFLLAPDVMELWMGSEFAERSTVVMRWLALGVMMNSLAQIPYALIQAAGKPRVTASLHLVELPVYLLAIWLLLPSFGVAGVAGVWAGRAILDGVLLCLIARRQMATPWRTLVLPTIFGVAVVLSLLIGSQLETAVARTAYLGLMIAFFGTVAWSFLLSASERTWLAARLSRSSP